MTNGLFWLWALVAIAAGFLLHAILFILLKRKMKGQEDTYFNLRKRFYRLSQLLLPLLAMLPILPTLAVSPPLNELLTKLHATVLIILIGGVLVQLVLSGRDLLLRRYDISVKDNLKARAIHTQLNILVKILVIAIMLIATATALMMFEGVRQIGTSLLASAGVIGIIVGFAAQRSIATLLAGLQLAFTQPIRIDDVVIVEGEWGQIEEITLTYVVVRIWDLRRLVVPTSYFLEQPFQNWTRTSADLLGSVTFHADYTLPVEAVRAQLYDIVKSHELWDGKVWRLHFIGAGGKTLELRALVSASSSGDAWELRCDIREKLLSYMQREFPECLPRLRTNVGEC